MRRKAATKVESKSGKPKPVVDRRHEILEAALHRFSERGFKGTSVREIARAVGVNEATLYHHFPSKAAILDAIIDHQLQERLEAFQLPEDPSVPLKVVLEKLAMRVFEQGQADGHEKMLVRLMMIEGPRLAVEGQYPFLRLLQESARHLMEAFSWLIRTGRMRKVDPRLAGMQFLAPLVVYGFHQHGLGGNEMEPISVADFVRSHVELFVRAFSP